MREYIHGAITGVVIGLAWGQKDMYLLLAAVIFVLGDLFFVLRDK